MSDGSGAAQHNTSHTGDAAVRITDDDRQQVLQRLRTATGDGLLSLDEFGERTAAALAATTRGELAPIVADLPTPAASVTVPRSKWGFIVSIFGGGDRKGRWHLAENCIVLNLFGGADLDLADATVTAQMSTITVLSAFGGSTIYIPPGIDVDPGGLAIFGSNDVNLTRLNAEPGAPIVRIRAYSLFGGTDVEVSRAR